VKAGPILRSILLGLILLLVIGGVLGVITVRRSFPQTDGTLSVPGLQSTVEVYRDPLGVPHIYASSVHDLFFAQGFVSAQDRFWQMDFWRHIGSARLSELFGESQLDTDRFLRTLGWARVARQELELATPETMEILNAYSEGVNAYLADHSGPDLSLEYVVLGLTNPDYQVEPWEPLHTLTWAKVMAWDLRGNMDEEIERAQLVTQLGLDRTHELFPDYPADGSYILPDPPFASTSLATTSPVALSSLHERIAALDALTGGGDPGLGSNNWALSASKTTTGAPIVANDPHLGIQMPGIWYQIGLHCRPVVDDCPFNVAGVSFAGVPGVVVGHNTDLAWGVTNLGPDVMDLYIERINPDNANQYEVNGEWVDMTSVEETILVAGGDPITQIVRYTRHGPVISDTYEDATNLASATALQMPEPFAISLRWTALEPGRLIQSVVDYNRARTLEEFREALRNFNVPAQNFVIADREGNIAYQMPGDVPIRAQGDGWLPVPGWNNDFEWTGYIPFDQLPWSLNPPQGYIVTANQAVVGPDYPHLITRDWDYGYRARRLNALFQGQPAFSPQDIQAIQTDNQNPMGPIYVPLVRDLTVSEGAARQAQSLVTAWDFQNEASSSGAAVFNAFFRHLVLRTLADQIPDRLPGADRAFIFLESLSDQPTSPWWDDVSTSGIEDRTAILTAAFEDAVSEVAGLSGNDPSSWSWGELHLATFRNQTFGESGIAPIEALFNRGGFPSGGGGSIVNATNWRFGEGYAVTSGPSMRMIQDLSDWDRSFLIHTTGESGHAFHPHYIDMAPTWSHEEYAPFLWSDDAVQGAAVDHLTLEP
jgi:penicillin amidase